MSEPFRVHILGCGSALPTMRHNPSSQVVELRGKQFMRARSCNCVAVASGSPRQVPCSSRICTAIIASGSSE